MFDPAHALQGNSYNGFHIHKLNTHHSRTRSSHNANSRNNPIDQQGLFVRSNPSQQISDTVKSNLKYLSQILEANDPSLMISISLSDNQFGDDHIDQSPINVNSRVSESYSKSNIGNQHFELIDKFLLASKQPFQSIGYYNKILALPQIQNIITEPILYSTLFNSQIHPILTLYLQERTYFYKLSKYNEKILDIFYKYIFCEHGHIMQRNLRENSFTNLGKWFYEEGILNFFRKAYPKAQDFTIFFIKFMKYGLATLFYTAVRILQKKVIINDEDQGFKKDIQIIRIAYIEKYGIS